MEFDEIIEILGKRRAELVNMLESRAGTLALEKQHQIYGAINELDLFLQTISYYQQRRSEKELGPITLVRPPEEGKGIFSKIFEGLKDKIKTNR